jgi:membrane carboxypeptidase/penicillin-binding protein
LGEAAFLAGLPQSPAVYDIYNNPDVTLLRQQQVLVLMFQLSSEQDCIDVSNSTTPVCVDPLMATQAADQMKVYSFRPISFDAKYPHWVNFVRSQQAIRRRIYRSGFVVSPWPVLQDKAQQSVSDQVASLVDNNTHNGHWLHSPIPGEILAMVGSPDFKNDAISGQINMANPYAPAWFIHQTRRTSQLLKRMDSFLSSGMCPRNSRTVRIRRMNRTMMANSGAMVRVAPPYLTFPVKTLDSSAFMMIQIHLEKKA